MNVDDLVRAMHEHADRDAVPAPRQARIRSIERKVRAARRRRLMAASGAIAVVVALVLGLPHALSRQAAPLPATTPIKIINGYPEYARGGHLLTNAIGTFDQHLKMTVPAQTADVVVVVNCRPDVAVRRLAWFFDVAGKPFFTGDCARGDWVRVPAAAALNGTSFTVKFAFASADSGSHLERLDGTWSAAAYVMVPPSAYPFPPRPRHLPDLGLFTGLYMGPDTPVKYLRGTGDETMSYTFKAYGACHWQCLTVLTSAQTPGFLHIKINGVPYRDDGFYDYTAAVEGRENRDAELAIVKMQQVTVTVTAEGMTGQWEAAFVPYIVGSSGG
jgi:hypothetical protein